MNRSDFRRGPFLFDFEKHEHEHSLEDPFSMEPAQMIAPIITLSPSMEIEATADQQVRPSHIFRLLDYITAKVSQDGSSHNKPPRPFEVGRRGKLNWRG
jgi:hypothetical protein